MTTIDERAFQHALNFNRGATYSGNDAEPCFRDFVTWYESAKQPSADVLFDEMAEALVIAASYMPAGLEALPEDKKDIVAVLTALSKYNQRKAKP